ncbi:MAG TPA: S9 family peptidase [Candidatus Sulfotelmatobacter sp.]|nr:S9 family peptidase [Candidatus Sulfotelmatobacter sp.]
MKLRRMKVSAFGLVCVVASVFVSGQQTSPAPRAITVDDQFQIKAVDDPQISADGAWVAYTVETASLKTDKSHTQIWMIPSAGGDPIAMTVEDETSTHPRWSPDGKYLAFLSGRNEGKTQVYLLNRQGGEAQKTTETVQDVEDFAWSPDSKQMALVLRDPKPEDIEEAKEKKDDASGDAAEKSAESKKSKTPRPYVIDRYLFKADEVGYLDHRRTHLYVFDLATKKMMQVTSGDFDDQAPAWSPDGKWLAFSSKRTMPDPDRNYDSNIFVVAADNTDQGAHTTQITKNPGADAEPAWSPDGKWITYVTQLDPKLLDYATKHVAISPAAGGEAKVLTKAFDRMASSPRFSSDGNLIYFLADDDGTQILCKVPVAGGDVTHAIGGRLMLYAYTVAKNGTVAATITTPERPVEVFTLAAEGSEPKRITHTNDAFISRLKLSMPEYVSFKSKDGMLVRGFVYKPLDYVSGKKYPAILRPHGGPVWAYYSEFDHLPQLFAANGYVVLLPNPRGSTGRGEPYAKAIFADWGNKDFQDDMAMVDYAVAQGLVDPDKLGVGGWSYGGISTDFIITQTTRFKAAISGAGSTKFDSMYGHDQYVLDYETELGRPWEKRDVWDHVSMYNKVANVTTPTLFMGGDIDWNVPILGGEQMYQSLKSLGKETELVVYPGEYHGFKTPSHLKDRLERYLAWYAHYVKADGTPATPAEKTEAKTQK